MKKIYIKPALLIVAVQQQTSLLLVDSVDVHNEKGYQVQFSRGSWDDDYEEESPASDADNKSSWR